MSVAVVIGGAVGLIAMGGTYATLGRSAQQTPPHAAERAARALCTWALIAIFLTAHVGYFVVDRFAPGFYYIPLKDPKNLWLLLQLACMVAYMVGVIIVSGGARRLSQAMA